MPFEKMSRNELVDEIKRVRMLIFERQECKNGGKNEHCEFCCFLNVDDEVCDVDRETAPVYEWDELAKRL